MKGVLTGNRTCVRTRSAFAHVVFVWLPVAIMLAVIARESTGVFSALHTSAWLRPIWQGVFGAVSDDRWLVLHHRLRKTGHFLGYGTLSITWMRAWLLTWMARFRLRTASAWRGWCFTLAIWCTATTASMDELHQTWLPGRTGIVQDVLLDTAGGLAFCSAIALFWFRSRVRNVVFTFDANASTSHQLRESGSLL